MVSAVTVLAAAAAASGAATVPIGGGTACPVNRTLFPPMSCPAGMTCKPAPDPNRFHCHEVLPCPRPHSPSLPKVSCNVCATCCHEMNATQCSSCVKTSCNAATFADYECCPEQGPCCKRGVPLPPSTSLKNCLLIGDSVTDGMAPLVTAKLKDVCQVQLYTDLTAGAELACFNTSGGQSALDVPIAWDVVHYNEGLHSLWPRVNTSDELAQWGQQLGAFTDLLQASPGRPSLVYATMTPFMPEKYLNPPGPPQSDVETKNALAVKTVQAHGVTRINDLYSVVTAHCGAVYKDCDICDDESAYHPEGKCGYHYVAAGWELLAESAATSIRDALSARSG